MCHCHKAMSIFSRAAAKKKNQPSTVMDTEMKFDASSFLNSVQHLSRTLTRSLPRLLLPPPFLACNRKLGSSKMNLDSLPKDGMPNGGYVVTSRRLL